MESRQRAIQLRRLGQSAGVLFQQLGIAGHELGFFIVQDGTDWLTGLDDSDTLSFVNSIGEAANVDDGSNIFIAVNGEATDETVFHSYSEDMNSDRLQHVLSGVEEETGNMLVGFEDITGGGDRDYEDVVFKVELGDGFAII